jgi:hypothetical protein
MTIFNDLRFTIYDCCCVSLIVGVDVRLIEIVGDALNWPTETSIIEIMYGGSSLVVVRRRSELAHG